MLPANVIRRYILVTDLSQQMKKQRDFLKWMARRYLEVNPEQSEAFTTGAEKLEELRGERKAGLFDAPAEEEVFTTELEMSSPADPELTLDWADRAMGN